MSKLVSTGLSHGRHASAEHAADAVKMAMERAELTRANGVILFLTPHYAQNPEPALRAAARAAGSMQIVGCTGAGILTDQEWLLDSAGAAAMVFGGGLTLSLPDAQSEQTVLSLCTPSGISSDWFDLPVPRIGAVSGDLAGQGPFKVWNGCRVAESGRAEVMLDGSRGVLRTSQGVRALTSPIEVADVAGYDVLKLGNYPALNVLVKSLPVGVRDMEQIPLHLIMGGVTFGDPINAIREGRYRLNHIVSANLNNLSITLSHPDFALLFPCMGRGPHFYGNRDRDLDLLRASFPDLPIIGFYGNGEIGPLDDSNHLYQYSTVLGLFSARSP